MKKSCTKFVKAVGKFPTNKTLSCYCYCASSNYSSTLLTTSSSGSKNDRSRNNQRNSCEYWIPPLLRSFPTSASMSSRGATMARISPFLRRSSLFLSSPTPTHIIPSSWRNYSSDSNNNSRGIKTDQTTNTKTNTPASSNLSNVTEFFSPSSSSEMGNTYNLSSDSRDCAIGSPSFIFGRTSHECSGSGREYVGTSSSSTAKTKVNNNYSPPTSVVFTHSKSFTPPIRTVVTSQVLVEVNRESSIMEQPKLLSKDEREEFMSMYHVLVKELLEIPDMKDMEETNRWMARVLQYNVPHGKRNRGLSTVLAYKYLAPEELTEENVRLASVLGWCVEILQAYFLVSDDIMDGSETRRGRPCWYKVDNLGLAAINDALLLEASIYKILQKHFGGKPCYARLMEIMHDVTYKTIFGQSLDTRTGLERRMETYTMERYSSIVKYKTSYYSFYLPVALVMAMCDIKDPKIIQQVRKVTLEMGHFFQVQDDYLDCFGDVEVTGKIGTDIQDCKCSWLFVIAMQRCNPDQKKLLLQNYGKHDPANVEAVKTLYKDLELEDVYRNYEEQTYNMISTHIQQMNDELPKGLFYDILHKIYKRSS